MHTLLSTCYTLGIPFFAQCARHKTTGSHCSTYPCTCSYNVFLLPERTDSKLTSQLKAVVFAYQSDAKGMLSFTFVDSFYVLWNCGFILYLSQHTTSTRYSARVYQRRVWVCRVLIGHVHSLAQMSSYVDKNIGHQFVLAVTFKHITCTGVLTAIW